MLNSEPSPNPDLFSVTLLGTGTCVPSLARASSAVLVAVCGKHLLVDAGLGCTHRMLAAGYDPRNLDGVFLTHFHPDHTAELVPLLFAGKYPVATARNRRLDLMGGEGLQHFYDGLAAVYGDWIDLWGHLSICEFSTKGPDGLWWEGIHLATMPVSHRPESLAIRISHKGRSVVITGDTDVCPDLVGFAQNCDFLICESAMPSGKKIPGHLTPRLAGEMARDAGAKTLVLTHFYPECEAVDVVAEAGEVFSGRVMAANDLDRFEV